MVQREPWLTELADDLAPFLANREVKARETPSSIELQRSSKGDYYWTIKIYYDATEPTAWSSVLAEIHVIDTQLRETYLTASA